MHSHKQNPFVSEDFVHTQITLENKKHGKIWYELFQSIQFYSV